MYVDTLAPTGMIMGGETRAVYISNIEIQHKLPKIKHPIAKH